MAAMRDQAIPIAKRRPPIRERGVFCYTHVYSLFEFLILQWSCSQSYGELSLLSHSSCEVYFYGAVLIIYLLLWSYFHLCSSHLSDYFSKGKNVRGQVGHILLLKKKIFFFYSPKNGSTSIEPCSMSLSFSIQYTPACLIFFFLSETMFVLTTIHFIDLRCRLDSSSISRNSNRSKFVISRSTLSCWGWTAKSNKHRLLHWSTATWEVSILCHSRVVQQTGWGDRT